MIDYYQIMDRSLKTSLFATIKDKNMHLIFNIQLTRDVANLPHGKPTLDYYKEWADKGGLFPFEQANIIAFLWGQHKCDRDWGVAHEFDISASFQPTEYLQRVHDYSCTKYPFDRNAIEDSLNRLPQTERDILYMYLWESQSMASIARQVGFENLRIEQILSVCHRRLAHYIAGCMRR